MKLVIGEPIADRNPRDTYVLCLKVMHGDADGYSTHEIMRVANDEFDLEDLYEALKVIDKTVDLNDQDEISGIIGVNKALEQNWPYDNVYNAGGEGIRASYEGHWVRYFDKAGQEFSVKVTSGEP